MIRLLSMLTLVLVLGTVISSCGGKNSTNRTPTPGAVGSAAAIGTARGGAASSQNTTPPAAGSSASATTQTPGEATAAAGAPGTGDTPSGLAGDTPGVTFSSPVAGEPSPGTTEAATAAAATATAVSAGPPGGAIAVGATSLVGGNVEVAVDLTGTGVPSFLAFQIHLRWNPSIFKFSSANSTGTILPGSVLCPAPVPDADGGGVLFACTGTESTEAASAGLLGTIVLTPVGTGCSPLHVFTYQGADGGDEGTGSYTMDKATNIALAVTVDGSVDQAGQHC